jgi:hypothetical protein
MPRKPASSQVGTMLRNLAESADDGSVTDAFVVVRGQDGTYDYVFLCDDLAEMLYEVGTMKIRARVEHGGKPTS